MRASTSQSARERGSGTDMWTSKGGREEGNAGVVPAAAPALREPVRRPRLGAAVALDDRAGGPWHAPEHARADVQHARGEHLRERILAEAGGILPARDQQRALEVRVV